MARTVGIGIQDFGKIIENNCFYVDKTAFIKEWWESKDDVTLITRPRSFGKTLAMSMLEQFFSIKYADRKAVFKGLSIWQEEKYRSLQGTYPVISISFANVKERDYATARRKICQIFADLYIDSSFLLESDALREGDKEFFRRVSIDMDDVTATLAIHNLAKYFSLHYGKKAIILLDEYDTPMQEAYVNGYWEELAAFTRSLFHSAFKTNPYLERAVMTGITRVGRESMFSDLNNLNVVTTTSEEYAACFGFTETEVFEAMDEFGMRNKEEVKSWYDGFTFGYLKDIYNPWSITNYLDKKKFALYWANTSSNSLTGNLLQKGNKNIKMQFEQLLSGETITCGIDEEIVYNRLDRSEEAVWSLLLAAGYLKVIAIEGDRYRLTLTNHETEKMFERMVQDWFGVEEGNYNDFMKALLSGDIEAMNEYMNRVSLSLFRFFDGGKHPSDRAEPERFYHGFVLGLLVDLKGKYRVTSNRESGFGRYDVLLEPLDKKDDGMILEFKVRRPQREKTLRIRCRRRCNRSKKNIMSRRYWIVVCSQAESVSMDLRLRERMC